MGKENWFDMEQTKSELKQDINDINSGIYADPLEPAPRNETTDEYHRERIREAMDDVLDDGYRRRVAAQNLKDRQERLEKERKLKESYRNAQSVSQRIEPISINDLKAKINSNEYIRTNAKGLTLLATFKEKFANVKQKIIAGSIAGILVITTIAYGEYQRHSFEEHNQENVADYIVPTKAEYNATLTQEQLQEKRKQQAIDKVMNYEEVASNQLNDINVEEKTARL